MQQTAAYSRNLSEFLCTHEAAFIQITKTKSVKDTRHNNIKLPLRGSPFSSAPYIAGSVRSDPIMKLGNAAIEKAHEEYCFGLLDA